MGTGEIGGRLPNGVYYSNRMQPAAGGSDKEFPVVAQEDLDALRAAATSAAPELAAEVIARDQPGEEILLPRQPFPNKSMRLTTRSVKMPRRSRCDRRWLSTC